MLINAGWDKAQGLLSSFSKGRGLGDCGTTADYAWDGERFRLVEQARWASAGSIDYITTWRAQVIAVGLRARTRRLGLGEEDREPLVLVGPFLDHAPAGGAEQQAAVAMAVFVAVLGVDGLARLHREAARRRR